MNANEYNANQLKKGFLSDAMVTKLVEFWQRHNGLAVDGFAGPNTIHTLMGRLEANRTPMSKYFPLRNLPDGRRAVITSGFYTENPSRSTHHGVDFFYPWQSGDPMVAGGDGGAVIKHGNPKWWYPEGTYAVAAADGVVSAADNTKTGWRVWIDHRAERTGYFHMQNSVVSVGDKVLCGEKLGLVGDNPSGHDAKHLHFEVSPIDRYAPMNPRLWLEGAGYLTA